MGTLGPSEGLETIILVHTNRIGAQYSLPQCPGCIHYIQLCEQVLAEGEGRNDKQYGEGVKTWPDGGRYEGEYANGERHGQGVYTYPDGTRYEGEWRNGEKWSGVETAPDARTFRFIGGVLVDN